MNKQPVVQHILVSAPLAQIGCSSAFRYRPRGFTLIELVTVLLIVSVLSVAVLPRLFERDTFDAKAFGDRVQAMVRYAQRIAIAQNRNVFVMLGSTRVALCYDSACTVATRVSSPTGANSGSAVTQAACGGSATWFCEGVPTGVTFSSNPANVNFSFSGLGKPFLLGDTPSNSTFSGLAMSIAGGGVTSTIVTERETGYVH